MQGSKASSTCWDVSQHCSVGSQKDDIFKDPAVRKGRHRSDVKNRVLHSFLSLQLWKEAIPNNSHLGLAVHHFQLSLTPAHLVILVLVFFTKFCWCPLYLDLLYLLPAWASSWAPHRVLPDTFVMTRCAICHVNPQFTPCLMADLQSPHHKYPTPYTSSWHAECSAYYVRPPKNQREQRHLNTDFQKLFQVHLRVSPHIKNATSLQGKQGV